MKLINLKIGLAQDGETCFSEAGFQNEDGAFWVFCMEADELCLLVRSEMPMLELAESMDLTEGMPYEVRSADCGGEAPEMQEIECDLFELIAYCGESELEHFVLSGQRFLCVAFGFAGRIGRDRLRRGRIAAAPCDGKRMSNNRR